MSATFPKSEKLCGQIHIAALYKRGKRLTVWPLRVTYLNLPPDETEKTKVLIWAPKSLFHHAVDRNHLRRLMREAYRKNKTDIENCHLQVAFNYIDKQQQPYPVIERAMQKAIRKIVETNPI